MSLFLPRAHRICRASCWNTSRRGGHQAPCRGPERDPGGTYRVTVQIEDEALANATSLPELAKLLSTRAQSRGLTPATDRPPSMATPERYVIDTNVLVSFLLFYGSVPGHAVTNRGPAPVR
jgi:hypothetical protein